MISKIFTFLLAILIITPALGVSTTMISGVAGSVSYHRCVSMEVANDGLNWPVFGANNTGSPYTYDGSQTSILTNGRTTVEHQSVIDQSTSNSYASQTTLTTDYMGLAEDTAGMLNIQPNIPESMCDQGDLTMIGSNATSGSYPYSESFEGRTGAVMHDGGAYQSEVGLNDGNVHLSGAADIESKGYLYQNKIVTSKKGFDKNSTALNLDTSETMNYIARTAIKGDEYEVHKVVVSDYTSITDAFDDVIAIEATNETITSISADRVDDEVLNSTIEVNETLVNQTHNESKGLEEISGQSIIRD